MSVRSNSVTQSGKRVAPRSRNGSANDARGLSRRSGRRCVGSRDVQRIAIREFGAGGLALSRATIPAPTADQVLVRLTSVGVNHADVMMRDGHYRLRSGPPPFVPGLEGGGTIEAVGPDVRDRYVGQRVHLCLTAPSREVGMSGTYTTHYLTAQSRTIPAPDAVADAMLGGLWQAYLTPWSCLVWKHALAPNATILLPSASSSVAICATQVLKHAYPGCKIIGLTTQTRKVPLIGALPEARYDHVLEASSSWVEHVRTLTHGRGVDVIFDPIFAGDFLNAEIRVLAQGGSIFAYGLLGSAGKVDVQPIIRKRATIRGWILSELMDAEADLRAGYDHVLHGFSSGEYQLPVAGVYPLADAERVHATIRGAAHIGKLILRPDLPALAS